MNDEKTIIEEQMNQMESNTAEQVQGEKASKSGMAMGTALGAGAGVLLGDLSSFAAGRVADVIVEDELEPEAELEAEVEVDTTSDVNHSWSDGTVDVALGVNDSMSFSEAFAAARAEVGPGGAFEWHGKVYGTYYAEEWNSMSAAEKAEYNSHFSWGGSSDNSSADNEVDVEIDPEDGKGGPVDDVVAVEADPEVEILGIYHDEELGADIAGVRVEGQDIFYVNVDPEDNDVIDLVVSDIDDNKQITEDEVIVLEDSDITISDFAAAEDDLLADNYEEQDYVNDIDDGCGLA